MFGYSKHSSICLPQPDISPDRKWRIPMKYLIRAAFVALSLATLAPVAYAATASAQQSNLHSPSQRDRLLEGLGD